MVQYLGTVGFFKALEESEDMNSDFLRYTVVVSRVFQQYFGSMTPRRHARVSKMWGEAIKLFKSVSNPSLSRMSKSISLLYNVQKKIKNQEENEKMIEFVQKWVPKFDIDDTLKVKVHAFDMSEKKKKMLFGDSLEVLSKAVTYPIDFSPIDNYVSLAWVFGIPEGDGIIYIDWLNSFTPQKAADYLLLSTFHGHLS